MSQEESIWDHITDHPKVAGVLALLAFAATFSPKASTLAAWACVLMAWVLVLMVVAGIPLVKTSKRPWVPILITATLLGLGLFRYGRWLTTKTDAPEVVAEGSEWSRQIQEPTLLIEPEWEVKAKSPGVFQLSLHNIGSSDVRGVEIWNDYLTVTRSKPLTIQRFGQYIDLPDVSLPNVLKAGSAESFDINFSKLIPAMENRRQSWFKNGNVFLNLLRIRVTFRRNSDGRKFSMMAEYVNSPQVLLHLGNRRGIDPFPGEPLNLDEVRKAVESLDQPGPSASKADPKQQLRAWLQVFKASNPNPHIVTLGIRNLGQIPAFDIRLTQTFEMDRFEKGREALNIGVAAILFNQTASGGEFPVNLSTDIPQIHHFLDEHHPEGNFSIRVYGRIEYRDTETSGPHLLKVCYADLGFAVTINNNAPVFECGEVGMNVSK